MSDHAHGIRVDGDEVGESPQARFQSTRRAISWCATYIANLFVPGLFGLSVCGNGVALVGMILGVLALIVFQAIKLRLKGERFRAHVKSAHDVKTGRKEGKASWV